MRPGPGGRERERERERQKREGLGVLSEDEPHGPTRSSPHTPDWGPLAAETRTEPRHPGGRHMQGKGVSKRQEATSLWRMEGSLLGEKGYPGRKACVNNRRALARPHLRNALAMYQLPLPTAALHVSR